MVGLAAVAAALAVWWAVPVPSLARLGPERRDRWSAWAAGVLDGLRAVLPRRAAVDRDRALRASVPQVCDLLAVCLDAGRPTRTALRVVASVLTGPVADELRGVLQRIELGLDEAEAWASLSSVAGYREVGRDLARSVRSGLGLAGLLRQHAADLPDNALWLAAPLA